MIKNLGLLIFKNKYRILNQKLFVYADNIHKHKAQNPENLEV
ncbi:MAG: hypothetical protein Q8754_03005 [Sweet potato little leaf phytoplasma]|nr:hypothetical protein [Sweet potato little leaf phytoplasma]